MLRLCDCVISTEDADTLIALLEADVTLASDEAAAAIRFARDSGLDVDALDPDIRAAIVQVLADPLPDGLQRVRGALQRGCC